MKLLPLSNRETENRAIEAVIAHEKAAGRTAVDFRGVAGSQVDMESADDVTGEVRLIEIKAIGGRGRGDDLWLEPKQVDALGTGAGVHLYVVVNARAEDPSAIRILDLAGERLSERLKVKREKHYYEVPLPVRIYDELDAAASAGASRLLDDREHGTDDRNIGW